MGDYNGHVGLGVKCSKEVATAIRGAIVLAKLSIIPVRLGYWGNKIGTPHTVPCKVSVINKQTCSVVNVTVWLLIFVITFKRLLFSHFHDKPMKFNQLTICFCNERTTVTI